MTQLPKNSSNPNDLQNKRHIHDWNPTAKLFSHVVLPHTKDTLLNSMSKYQLACKPGHRPSEHLFLLKSVFAYYNQKKKGILVAGYDIKSFFDSEDAYDVFSEVYSSGVKGKIYRLLFQLNKNTKIKIRTPVGDTQSKDSGPIITQGGIEAAILSSVSIDRGTDVTFAASDSEAEYHGLKLAPFRWMDNIPRVGESVASAQYANTLMEDLFEQKSLSFNLSKSKESEEKNQNRTE